MTFGNKNIGRLFRLLSLHMKCSEWGEETLLLPSSIDIVVMYKWSALSGYLEFNASIRAWVRKKEEKVEKYSRENKAEL